MQSLQLKSKSSTITILTIEVFCTLGDEILLKLGQEF